MEWLHSNVANRRLDILLALIAEGMFPYYEDILRAAGPEPRLQQDFQQKYVDGLDLYELGLVSPDSTMVGQYLVASQSNADAVHVVYYPEKRCDCEYYKQRSRLCKHVIAASFYELNGPYSIFVW